MVRQTGPNDRVTHPINELSVFRIRNFRLIHPECFERYSFRFGIEAPETILIRWSHLEGTSFNQDHPVRIRLVERSHLDANQFAAVAGKQFSARGRQQHDG